ncbi:YrbE family protein YrbEA [Nocardia nova SH22a]|uniref:YrbE family protein YrbEA n=1 Tax=Nocardia nova SH22a TaxID=1415166 RepID=W5TBH7_9NOCA|nr:ABC transporter permease [Nocardia nova]AHH16323.1 YrbE family protein YrbEA [Nocardia nova SH22a]
MSAQLTTAGTRTASRPPGPSDRRRVIRFGVDYWHDHPQRSVETAGRQVLMTGRALLELITSIVRRRFPWQEFVRQCAFMAGVSATPTLLVAVPIAVVVSIQIGSLVSQVGATTFIGAVNGLGIIRQGAPLVTSLMIAGAVGSSICADLGSRTIREEIDAMTVMGVDPVRRLVAPRLAAAVLVSTLLCGLVVFVGFATGYAFNVYMQSGTPGSYIRTFASFAVAADLVVAMIKAAIFGALAAIIACDTGLHARGGPAGVADAVNSAVVNSAIILFGANILITQMYATVLPSKVL